MTKLDATLFSSPDPSYESARSHSEWLDRVLRVEVQKIEDALLQKARALDPQGSHKSWGHSLHGGNQTWVGLSHQTLQTPYNELKHICELLRPGPGATVVDLGAGYGRLGLVLGVIYPEVHFLGFEYVSERVKEGQRILERYGCQNASLKEQDLTAEDFQLPVAQFYFLYDYGNLAHIRKTLQQLERIGEKHNFKLVARGKGTVGLVQYEFPWLSQVYPPVHEEHFSIYSMSAEL